MKDGNVVSAQWDMEGCTRSGWWFPRGDSFLVSPFATILFHFCCPDFLGKVFDKNLLVVALL